MVEGGQISTGSGNGASTVRHSMAWIAGALAMVAAGSALPQGNIDAGKSPAQMFADTCSNCHRRPSELKRGASAGFLRQHYTPGAQEAAAMASYLASIPAAKERPRAQDKAKAKAQQQVQQQAQERPKAQPAPKGKRPELAKSPPPEPPPPEVPPETRAEVVVPKLEPFEE
jgi:hypothetical protein